MQEKSVTHQLLGEPELAGRDVGQLREAVLHQAAHVRDGGQRLAGGRARHGRRRLGRLPTRR